MKADWHLGGGSSSAVAGGRTIRLLEQTEDSVLRFPTGWVRAPAGWIVEYPSPQGHGLARTWCKHRADAEDVYRSLISSSGKSAARESSEWWRLG
jgi:hypothetical protein